MNKNSEKKIIIDANCLASVFGEPVSPEFSPVVRCIFLGRGVLSYGGSKLKEEYEKNGNAMRRLKVLDQAGRLRIAEDAQVDALETGLSLAGELKSDDPHIVALAVVSGARVLVSHDVRLHADFTNLKVVPAPKGKVYQNSSHASLLT